MELKRRYEGLDLHVDGDVQDQKGKSLHTYLVHHFHLPATQFPELDPALKAPMDAELWSTDVELFRETSPIMGADIITTWLAGMSVYQDPVHSKKHIDKDTLAYTRGRLFQFVSVVGHPCFETPSFSHVVQSWNSSITPEQSGMLLCACYASMDVDEETNEHVHDHVVVSSVVRARARRSGRTLWRVHPCREGALVFCQVATTS